MAEEHALFLDVLVTHASFNHGRTTLSDEIPLALVGYWTGSAQGDHTT